jgi:hypothetical protein
MVDVSTLKNGNVVRATKATCLGQVVSDIICRVAYVRDSQIFADRIDDESCLSVTVEPADAVTLSAEEEQVWERRANTILHLG